MIISHNIQAMNTNRITNENISLHGKSTEKVSSGYRINCAADDAAGLGISEVMRRQIRGLMQASNNTKDGVAFVQTADGAMEEIHTMLQRMNELTVKALQGTWSDSDRMAMNVEFDQLRTEIDRINNTTDFGTGIPVFEEHEPSYYQISGSKRWDDNQLHTISSMANELNIHLPDSYEPKDYTITVPAGVYTTQELIDEIDDALSSMLPPNPGFALELTSDGYCNLNFEKADGTPTKIDFVDGSLAYLIYDFQGGSMSASILGTTIFEINGKLPITQGRNDTIGFYMESAAGTNYVTITIPAKSYTRAEMIDKINELLAKDPNAAGVVAKEYGENCIQITGGDKIGIVGLKGNMFKYEKEGVETVYTSVFYDNVNYGVGSKTAAYITGNYYDPAIPISINASNNTLRFKLNGSNNYTTITLTNKDYKDVSELVGEINQKLQAQGLDQAITASGSNYLTLRCTLTGSQSKLVFDTTPGTVYNEAYKTLFLGTSRLPDITQGYPARLTGAANLSGTISLDADASFSFKVDGTEYTISNIGGTYNLSSLVQKLNNEKQTNKITFEVVGNNLSIKASSNDVSSITSGSINKTFKYLFTGRTTTVNYRGKIAQTSGSINRPQGSTRADKISATTTVDISSAKTPITLDQNNNQLVLYFSGTGGRSHYETITLNSGTYNDISALVNEIRNKLQGSTNEDLKNTTVSYSGGKLTFTSPPSDDQPNGTWNIQIPSYTYNDSSLGQKYVWKTIFGTSEGESGPTSQSAKKAQLTQNKNSSPRIYIPSSTTLDSSNNILTLDLGNGPATITLDPKTYTRGELQQALQTKLDNSGLTPSVTVNINNSGYLTLSAVEGTFSPSGSFYENVIIRQFLQDPYQKKDGDSSFKQAFIVGSKDLTVEPIEIVSGSNDIFTFDFTYNSSSASSSSFVKTMSVTIPEGIYNGDSLAKALDAAIKKEFVKEGLNDFEVTVGIGTRSNDIKVENLDAKKTLHITVTSASGKEPAEGQYIIDGVRGNSACFVFYKTTGKPKETYILGTKNIGEGVSFEPGKNVLTLSVNSVPYKYTFDKPYYTAQEFLDTLNNMFENGDDNGNSAPLKASIENGVLKISHNLVGANTITDIGGSGRSAIFFEEEGRDSRDPLLIHVGSEAYQNTEIPRISVSSNALAINSITISKQKYAEKANTRIKEAIDLLSSKRSTYGAIQNRLEHTINNNDIVIDRMQASESRIRDTDLSSEMIRYSNLSILLRMGSTMIAETNQRIEKIMTILQ